MKLVPILAALICLAATAAQAAPACAPPPNLRPASVLSVRPGEPSRGIKTVSNLLALSWSPEFCRSQGGRADRDPQCQGDYGLILHGLWPSGSGRDHPRFCTNVGAIDPATVRQMFCRTPSASLMQHEWQAHGSCGWSDASAYFADAAKLYDAIRMPRLEALPGDRLTAGTIRTAFVAANPGLPRRAIMVRLDRAQRLTEIDICHDLKLKPAACMGGIGAPDPIPVRLTPSRSRGF